MKISISTENERVAAHFGRCSHYTFADIEGDKIVKVEKIMNPGHQPGYLPRFLNEKNVDCIIAGGMGHKARNLFDQFGIKTILGVQGDVNATLELFAKGKLIDGESLCDHGSDGHGSHVCRHETVEKICITAKGDNLDSEVDPRFGRCEYFLFVNPVSMEFDAVPNVSKNEPSGAGTKAGQLVSEKEAKTVLTGKVGPKAAEALNAAGIKVIQNKEGTVRSVVTELLNGG